MAGANSRLTFTANGHPDEVFPRGTCDAGHHCAWRRPKRGADRRAEPRWDGSNITARADFGQTPGSSQSSTVPFAGVAIPAPCTRGGPNAAALSTFDGGALSPTSGGLSPAASFATSGTPAGLGAESSTSAPCNSVSSSGVMSAPNSAATTVLSANSYSLPSSTSSGSSAPATANGSPNIKNLGVTALGTSGLGTTDSGRPASAPCRPSPDRHCKQGRRHQRRPEPRQRVPATRARHRLAPLPPRRKV